MRGWRTPNLPAGCSRAYYCSPPWTVVRGDEPGTLLHGCLGRAAVRNPDTVSQVEEYSNTCNRSGLILTGICFRVDGSIVHLEEETPNSGPCNGAEVSQADDSGLHRQMDVPDLRPDPFSGGRALFHLQGRNVAGSRVVRPGGRDEDARVNRGRSAGWMLSLTCFYRPTPVETPWPLHGQPPEAEPRARFAGILCPDNHLRRSRGHVLPSFGAQITTQGGSAAMFSRFSIKIYYEKHMKRKGHGEKNMKEYQGERSVWS